MKLNALVVTATACCVAPACGLAAPPPESAPVGRRAVVVGINRYDATPSPSRPMDPLQGAVSDARAFADVLQKSGFEVQLLLDEQATRDGILAGIRNLAKDAAPGDLRVFYFSGHGSYVQNPASPEPDKLDETIVPFDAPAGARDLRDKELAKELGAVVDRGAVLTIVLDSCHSGGAVRGRTDAPAGAQAKFARMDPRAVSDPSLPVAPEFRGALVLSAAQDVESALELKLPAPRGAFTAALVEALQDPGASAEPAYRIFLRTRQLMKGKTPQNPVLAGTPQRQRSTLFEAAPAAVTAKTEVPVVAKGERFQVDAGRALGLGVGSVLGMRDGGGAFALKLEVTALDGPSSAVAVFREGNAKAIGKGAILEVLEWSATPGTNLLVDLGDTAVDSAELDRLRADLEAVKKKVGAAWVDDPAAATHWLERELTAAGPAWALYGPTEAKPLRSEEVRGWTPPSGAKVYAVLPPPAALANELRGRWQRPGGLVSVAPSRAEAHYRLVGRLGSGEPEYGLVRASRLASGATGVLPTRTGLVSIGAAQGGAATAAVALRDAAERLARIYGWLVLKSPAPSDAKFPYQLVLRRADGELKKNGDLVLAGETYGLALRAEPAALQNVQPRWVYVFAMDSFGRRQLVFPMRETGDVENRVPRGAHPAPVITLAERLFTVAEPYGRDSYFLLATDAKLPDPEVLNEEGVRTRGARGAGGEALPVDLLAPVTQRTRGVNLAPRAADWTVRRIEVTSAETAP